MIHVQQLIKPRQFMTPAIEWGIKNEALAIQAYTQHQQCNGHDGLTVCKVGFHVSRSRPLLDASPDGVYDPSCDQSYEFVEVKSPYSHRNHTPAEAFADNKFFWYSWKWSGEITTEFKLILPSTGSDGNRRKTLVWLCCLYTKGNQHQANHIWSRVME